MYLYIFILNLTLVSYSNIHLFLLLKSTNVQVEDANLGCPPLYSFFVIKKINKKVKV